MWVRMWGMRVSEWGRGEGRCTEGGDLSRLSLRKCLGLGGEGGCASSRVGHCALNGCAGRGGVGAAGSGGEVNAITEGGLGGEKGQ